MNRLIYRILSSPSGACIQIRILLRQTARVFGVDAPRTAGMSASELLRTYAQFTSGASRNAMDSGQDLEQLHQKLYDMAYHLGSSLRQWMRPHGDQDCLAILTLLYKNIEILINERAPGEFYVRKCYFSAFYTPEVCRLISGIDQGIFAGIYQRGKLTFEERITEGYNQCKANLE